MGIKSVHSRRDFVRAASAASLALPLVIGCRSESLAKGEAQDVLSRLRRNAKPRGTEGMGAIEVPDGVTSRVSLPVTDADGERIIISGTVYSPDGRTPAPNILIYFYHTDKFGIYGRGGEPKHGRYRGWMLTDAAGRYEFSSIRPASYPNSTISQHVHMTVTGLDRQEDWIDSILFEGGRFITAREREQAGKRGGFQPIITLARDSRGIMRGTRDIRLMPA